jgi:ABC-type branched-subunit amino acid transport system substrate-binding protein
MRPRRHSTLFRLLAVLFTLSLVAAACGGEDDDDDAGGGAQDGELQAGPGFDGTTIKVGVLTPLSGPVADPIGLPLTAGGDVYWQRVNAEGGIAGQYPVEQVKEDTQYDIAQTKAKYTQIKNDVALFSQLLGTPPTQAVLVDLKADDIVASPASLESAWVREPNLLPVGSTYEIQFINAATYLIEERDFADKPICMVAIEGAYGDSGLQGLEFAAEQLDFEIAVTARYASGAQDFTAQVQQLRNANCAAVFLTSLPSETGRIIGTAAQAGFTPQWVGQSPTWVSALAASQVGPVLQRSFLWASEGVQWGDESVPGMKQMLEDVQKYKPDQQPDPYFVFGYVQALTVHALLEQAVENGDLSREGILEAVTQVEVDYQGLLGGYEYGPAEERSPSRQSTIFSVDPAVPGSLKSLTQVESDAAKAFEFD